MSISIKRDDQIYSYKNGEIVPIETPYWILEAFDKEHNSRGSGHQVGEYDIDVILRQVPRDLKRLYGIVRNQEIGPNPRLRPSIDWVMMADETRLVTTPYPLGALFIVSKEDWPTFYFKVVIPLQNSITQSAIAHGVEKFAAAVAAGVKYGVPCDDVDIGTGVSAKATKWD
jgi:hypothetical protein